jgi:hypothetical protein
MPFQSSRPRSAKLQRSEPRVGIRLLHSAKFQGRRPKNVVLFRRRRPLYQDDGLMSPLERGSIPVARPMRFRRSRYDRMYRAARETHLGQYGF